MKEAFINELLTWLRTPWFHHGRVKHIGVDCIGVIVESAKTVFNYQYEDGPYSRIVDTELLTSNLEKFCTEYPKESMQIGDILCFNINGHLQHTGVLVYESTFIHAYESAGEVALSTFTSVWERTLSKVYRIKELE